MTEAEWLTAIDPKSMLEYVTNPPELSDNRKLRLFACACIRRLGQVVTDRRLRAALDTAEAFADGRALNRELEAVSRTVQRLAQSGYGLAIPRTPWVSMTSGVMWATDSLARAAAFQTGRALTEFQGCGLREQCDLLRDIFGNPFRPVALGPAWVRWNDRTVARLARLIYDNRTFDQMPILADALEEAGCADEILLRHCRQADHVRGCWVLDQIFALSEG
jgi:hypothetical protein